MITGHGSSVRRLGIFRQEQHSVGKSRQVRADSIDILAAGPYHP
jgi:hypothetical protein